MGKIDISLVWGHGRGDFPESLKLFVKRKEKKLANWCNASNFSLGAF